MPKNYLKNQLYRLLQGVDNKIRISLYDIIL
ncbi:MAG: hypothetical protein PWP52_1312 [Bacteroidales bacterium]|nr:hypothetical protein [Bacteroidales bacterium]